MPSQLVQTADAVTSALNAASLSLEFVAERSYADWDMQLEDADALHVDVVPVGFASAQLADRDSLEYRPEIDVGVRKRFGESDLATTTGRIDNEAIDELVLLVEEIAELFAAGRLVDFTDAAWQIDDVRTINPRVYLREMNQYTGIVRITFDVTKSLS